MPNRKHKLFLESTNNNDFSKHIRSEKTGIDWEEGKKVHTGRNSG
jgi:hypothetical protein